MGDEQRRQWKARLKYFSVYIAIFAFSIIALTIGYLIESLQPLVFLVSSVTSYSGQSLNSLLAHLSTEAGIAGLIACGLGVTIERLSAREFIRLAEDQRVALIEQAQRLSAKERDAIKQDVFYYTFGIHLPTEIRSVISTQILTEPFIRRKMSMYYVLRPLTDVATRSDYVMVDFEMRYDIVNLTNERKSFPLRYSFRKSPIETHADEAKILSIDVTGSEVPLALTEGRIPIKSDKDFISLDHNEPVWVKPGLENSTTVKIHSKSVKHCAGGLSYFTLDYHTCDLELSVHVPDNSLHVYSGASPGNSFGEWLVETFRHKPNVGIYNWQLKSPLLAFQGVYVGWDPKGTLAAQPLTVPKNPLPSEAPVTD